MKVAIGSDHAGFELKEKIKKHLSNKGIKVTDLGTDSPDSVDYPDFAFEVANKVSTEDYPFGVLICGSGAGMAMAANKVKGIRAAVGYDIESAKLARNHNDANILTIGARLTDEDTAIETVDAFFESDFDGGRHQRRINKMSDFEGS